MKRNAQGYGVVVDNYERFLAKRAQTELWLRSNELTGVTEGELISRATAAGLSVQIDMRDGHGPPMATYACATEVTAALENGRVVRVVGSYGTR